MEAGHKPAPAVRSLDRGLSILTGLTLQGTTLTELAKHAQLPLATVTRLLDSARFSGFVSRGADGRYRPGPALISLAYHFGRDDIEKGVIHDALLRLRDEVDETASFDVQQGDQRTSVDAVESRQTVRRSHPIGVYRPFHTGAAGKVLLAFGDTDRLLDLVPGEAAARGPNPANRRRLKAASTEVRSAGYSYAPMEIDKEAWGLAAPVFVGAGMRGVLVVSGPVTRSSDQHIRHCVDACVAAAQDLSERLSAIFGQPLLDRGGPTSPAAPRAVVATDGARATRVPQPIAGGARRRSR